MKIVVRNPEDLPAAARSLLPLLRNRGVVALYGGMGAGKTTLVSALMREMGSDDDVTSPTFALVNDYVVPADKPLMEIRTEANKIAGDSIVGRKTDGKTGGKVDGKTDRKANGRHVYHFDFYRIDSPAEAFDLGYEEYFYSGELCLVEWPEKIEELLPDDTLRLRIDIRADGSRVIEIA